MVWARRREELVLSAIALTHQLVYPFLKVIHQMLDMSS